MNRKTKIMLVGGAALVGGYFLLSRNAAAAELGGPSGGDMPGAGSGSGETGDLWTRLTQQLFPGGGTKPLPLGVPGGSPGSRNPKPGKPAPTTFPGGGTKPLPLGVPGARPGSNKPAPTKKPPPVAINQNPRPAPKKTPIALRAAQGVLGRKPTPKGFAPRALD